MSWSNEPKSSSTFAGEHRNNPAYYGQAKYGFSYYGEIYEGTPTNQTKNPATFNNETKH